MLNKMLFIPVALKNLLSAMKDHLYAINIAEKALHITPAFLKMGRKGLLSGLQKYKKYIYKFP